MYLVRCHQLYLLSRYSCAIEIWRLHFLWCYIVMFLIFNFWCVSFLTCCHILTLIVWDIWWQPGVCQIWRECGSGGKAINHLYLAVVRIGRRDRNSGRRPVVLVFSHLSWERVWRRTSALAWNAGSTLPTAHSSSSLSHGHIKAC